MSDGDALKSFLYEIGFTNDPSGAAKVEAQAKQLEARLASTAEAGAAKRVAIEEAAGEKTKSAVDRLLDQRAKAEAASLERRKAAARTVLLEMLGFEEDAAGKLTKRHKENVGKAIEVNRDQAKKAREIRATQMKDLEAGLLRFTSIVQGVGTGLSTALAAAPFGSFLMGVERTAAGLSRMSVQAQRVGASVAGIERMKFALRQQGVDEGETNGALEGFASRLKDNPQGYRQVLERMGVKTKDRSGKDLDTEQLLEALGPHFASLPFNQARIQAGQLGIQGDNALNALRDPAGTRKGLDAYDAKLKGFGFDPDKAAADARKVDQAYNNLATDLHIVATKLQAEFFDPLVLGFDSIAKKLEANPQAVESYGRALEAGALAISARVLPVLTNLAVRLSGLGAVLGTGLGTAVGIAVNPVVVAGASAESTPTAPVTTDPAERARKLANNTLPAGEMTPEEREAFSKAHGGGLWSALKRMMGFGGDADDTKVKADIASTAEATKKLADKANAAEGGGEGSSFASTGGTMGAVNRLLGRARAATGQGYTPAGGGGNTPAKGAFAANQKEAYAAALKEGLSPTAARALVANMSGEGLAVPHDYHWDGTHMASGIVQWDPARSARIKAQFGAMPHQLSVADQTRAAIWEMKTRPEYAASWKALQGNNAADMIGALVDNYERPKQRALPKAQRMGYYRGFNPGDGKASDPAPAASAPAIPSTPIGDQAALDAQKRIAAGQGTSADHATIAAHREQQNTPPKHGKPLPSYMAKDGSGEGIVTVDYRDPRYAPKTGNHPDDDRASRARTTYDGPYGARGHLSPVQFTHGGGENALTHLYKDGALKVEVTKPLPGLGNLKNIHELIAKHAAAGTLIPKLHPEHLVSSRVRAEINNSRSHVFNREGDTFHVHGTDAKSGLDQAHRVSARRDAQDRIRYMQGNQQ